MGMWIFRFPPPGASLGGWGFRRGAEMLLDGDRSFGDNCIYTYGTGDNCVPGVEYSEGRIKPRYVMFRKECRYALLKAFQYTYLVKYRNYNVPTPTKNHGDYTPRLVVLHDMQRTVKMAEWLRRVT